MSDTLTADNRWYAEPRKSDNPISSNVISLTKCFTDIGIGTIAPIGLSFTATQEFADVFLNCRELQLHADSDELIAGYSMLSSLSEGVLNVDTVLDKQVDKELSEYYSAQHEEPI